MSEHEEQAFTAFIASARATMQFNGSRLNSKSEWLQILMHFYSQKMLKFYHPTPISKPLNIVFHSSCLFSGSVKLKAALLQVSLFSKKKREKKKTPVAPGLARTRQQSE